MKGNHEFYENATYPVTVYIIDYEKETLLPVKVLDYTTLKGAKEKTIRYKNPINKFVFRGSVDMFYVSKEYAEFCLKSYQLRSSVIRSIKAKINSDVFTEEERTMLLAILETD